MAFEPERYEREVVRPMRGRRTQLTDDDLVRRYAIEPGLDDPADLKAHLKRLRTYWNQTASGPDSRAQVCKRLLAADEELQRRPDVELSNPLWWQEYSLRRDADARRTVAQLATDLKQAYGSTGQLTRTQVKGIADQHPALDPAHIEQAVREAGLRVVDVIDLPTESGLDRAAYRELTQRLRETGVLTVVHLLHPDLNRPFALVQRFAVDQEPVRALDRPTLDERIAKADQAADTPNLRARRAALRVLQTGVRGGADLRVIALFQIVEQLLEGRANSIADSLLIRQATRIGLTQDDAELVVASLPSGSGGGSAGAAAVRDLLASGQLRAAQTAVAALPATDPERTEIVAEIAGLEQQLSRLLSEVEQALRGQREEEAERLITQARRIAEDDADVQTRARRVPLPPPRDLRAVVADSVVQLDWQAPHSAATDIRYRVLRRTDAAPGGPQDGTLIAETDGTAATDVRPPVAQDLHYAVFATSGPGALYSRAATGRTTFVPAVADVTVRTAVDRIIVAWQAHPDVVVVRARRTEARPPRGPEDGVAIAAGSGTFVDRQIREGTEYFYSLVAVYHDEQLREVPSRATVVSASPQAEARPLDGLRVEPVRRRGGSVQMRLTWPVDAGKVRVRYATGLPPWEFGTVVSPTELGRYGREVPGAAERYGVEMVLEADVPAGPFVYVPVTFGSSGAAVGRPVHVGQSEPVRQLHARRTGDRVVVTWVWPDDSGLAEVTWARPDAPVEVRRLTRGAYVDGDGCLLTVGPAGGEVTVRAITVGPAGETRSEPAVDTVSGRAVEVRYTLHRPPGWRNRYSRRRLLQIVADQDCDDVDLTVVVAPGLVMPLAVSPETVAETFEGLAPRRGVPIELSVLLPKVARPYWVRCFVTRPAGVTVIDPPVADLKVS